MKPRASVTSRRRSSAGQGRSGFTWSAVTGETPPQSSMPASSRWPKSSERLGGAWRCTSGGRIRRASAIAWRKSSGGHGGAPCIAVPALGRKFWTITSCTWPWRRWEAAMASRASMRSAQVLADADEDPRGERDRQPRRPPRGWPAGGPGVLSGAPRWQSRSARSDSIIIPWLGATARRRSRSARLERAGVGVGEQAGLVEHQLAHGGEVVDRGRVPVRGEPLGGHGVAVLGPLAEGEQGLVAAGRRARLRDGQHLVRAEVGRLEAGRAAGRTCSSRSGRGTAS